MGDLKYPQSNSIEGPWLIGRDAFEELHEIVVSSDEKLRRVWNQTIEDKVRLEIGQEELSDQEIKQRLEMEANNHWNNKHRIVCELRSSTDVKLVDNSITSLLQDNALREFDPISFYVNIEHGDLSGQGLDMSLQSTYADDFEYHITCTDAEASKEIQYELEKWIEKHRPSKLTSIWGGDTIESIGIFAAVPLIIFASSLFLPS